MHHVVSKWFAIFRKHVSGRFIYVILWSINEYELYIYKSLKRWVVVIWETVDACCVLIILWHCPGSIIIVTFTSLFCDINQGLFVKLPKLYSKCDNYQGLFVKLHKLYSNCDIYQALFCDTAQALFCDIYQALFVTFTRLWMFFIQLYYISLSQLENVIRRLLSFLYTLSFFLYF